jgi:hypothetical protein
MRRHSVVGLKSMLRYKTTGNVASAPKSFWVQAGHWPSERDGNCFPRNLLRFRQPRDRDRGPDANLPVACAGKSAFGCLPGKMARFAYLANLAHELAGRDPVAHGPHQCA